MMNLTSNIIEVEDSWEAANDWFCREKLSDGLPIVPPTPERVEKMLDGTHRDSQEVIGVIPPRWAPATVEKIAINAVMAGCLPEYLPVVIAAVEAICEPRFNLYGVQATTGYVGPALLINGPIRKQLEINCDAGVFGPGYRSNATIGRAIRLILITVGGGFPAIPTVRLLGGRASIRCASARIRRKVPGSPIMSRWVSNLKRARSLYAVSTGFFLSTQREIVVSKPYHHWLKSSLCTMV
jgi:hypothetical protein